MKEEFKQFESYIQLQKFLDFSFPLNFTRGWAASPDYLLVVLRELLKLIKSKASLTVLEVGSGVSTVVVASALRKFSPSSRLFSLEHDYDYYLRTKEELQLNGLDNVNLIYAPLVSYQIGGKEWWWYETIELFKKLDDTIDLIVVDGPPEVTQEIARYPVVPVMKDKLSEDFVLILDDFNRQGEKRAAYLWKRELKIFESDEPETEKGTLVLRGVPQIKKVKFSVCIPTYNRAGYLKEAIESVLNQTYSNFELVIYDDGSTDETVRVVRSFKDPRIRYYRGKENRGRPFARNRCIELSTGEWIVWLDDDDKMEPELLSRYLIEINKYPEVEIFYVRHLIVNNEKDGYTSRIMCDEFFKNKKQLIRKLMLTSPIPNPGVCVKRGVYEKFGGYRLDFLRAQDYEFWFRTLPFVDIKGLDYAGIVYRIHGNNVSTNMSLADLSYESLAKREFLNVFPLEEIYFFSKEKITNYFIKDVLNHGDIFNAAYYMWLSEGESSKLLELLNVSGLSIYRDNKLMRIHLKFRKFLIKEDFASAEKLAMKLGESFVLLTKGLSLLNQNSQKGIALIKRAYLMNPLIDLFLVPESLRPELKKVAWRLLVVANKFEEKKPEFLSWLGRDEVIGLYNS